MNSKIGGSAMLCWAFKPPLKATKGHPTLTSTFLLALLFLS